MRLEDWGWDRVWAKAIGGSERKKLKPARVVLEQRGRHRVVSESGERWVRPVGPLWRNSDPLARPAVGDWVLVETKGRDGLIHRVLPRRTQLVRRSAGRRTEPQVVAANIDIGFVVTTVTEELNPRRVERFLAAIAEGGANSVVALNKIDTQEDPDDLDFFAGLLADVVGDTVPCIPMSAKSRVGIEPVLELLSKGRTGVLVGASGVGKSTLINALLGKEAQRTAPVREVDQRGRHTTRQRELFPLPSGGLLVDTPGIRELQPWDLEGGLDEAFPDIFKLAADCRFRDCRHEDEPNCAVQAAVEADTLDPERVANYQKLQDEQASVLRPWDKKKFIATRERS